MVMVSRNKYPKNYIKELREERGWKLRDLEIKTGWSNQTLSNLELSKADLSWSKIQKLAEVFEVHPLEITAKFWRPCAVSRMGKNGCSSIC
jgi:transcriptional regulator with XRE-family HTH domain